MFSLVLDFTFLESHIDSFYGSIISFLLYQRCWIFTGLWVLGSRQQNLIIIIGPYIFTEDVTMFSIIFGLDRLESTQAKSLYLII